MGLLSSLFGSSNSSSSNATTQTDARVVGGDGSLNLSVTGSNNTLTDHAAVASGIQAALAGIESATRIAEQAQEASGGVLSGALRMAGEQQQQFTSALENIKTSDVRSLIITGMAVVGVVAVALIWRGRA